MIRALLAIVFVPQLAVAAACCGSNALFPSLISGDERMQLTLTTALSSVVGDAPVLGGYTSRDVQDVESRGALRIDFASLISDRWQVGASVPLLRRSREKSGTAANALGLGDVGLMVGYELVPQWSYSAWEPKVVVFAGLGLPTGRAPIDAQKFYQVDAMGRGHWTPSLGALAQKVWGTWDAIALAELHYPLARSWDTAAGAVDQSPSLGAMASIGAGWSYEDFRFGAMLTALFDGPTATAGVVDDPGASQASYPVTLQASYLFAEGWSLGMLYTDTSVLPARNAALTQSLSLLLQTRWDR